MDENDLQRLAGHLEEYGLRGTVDDSAKQLNVTNPLNSRLAEETFAKGDQYITGLDYAIGEQGHERACAGGVARISTRADLNLAASDWLLTAAEDTQRARKEWADVGIALLRCGTLFTAVRLSASLVHAAAGTQDLHAVDAYLTHVLLGGPAFVDTRWGLYYFLVSTSTVRIPLWGHQAPEAECLGRNTYLGVPDPSRTDPDDGPSYWCVPMDNPGLLSDPKTVVRILTHGRHQLAAAGRDDGD